MPFRRTTFSKFVIEDLRRAGSSHDPDLAALLNDIQRAAKLIRAAVSRTTLDAPGALVTTERVVEGEPAVPPEETARQILIGACEWGGQVGGILAAGVDAPYEIPAEYPRGRYLLLFNALDGADNIDLGLSVGSVFSILRAPDGVAAPTRADFLQPGRRQVAAGYMLYGSTAMLVITLGAGVHGFTLDREAGAFTLTHPNLRMPEETPVFAVDAGREALWEEPVRRFVAECRQGADGPRRTAFRARWIDSFVAEIHRVLFRGGVFLMPRDTSPERKSGELHLLYEANPVAMLIEQAGGAASTGRAPVLDVTPAEPHERTPLILGSRTEIARVEAYHQAYDRGEALVFDAPLFKHRTIFRTA